MTQRDALESKLELIETKKQQFNAVVNIYRDLGVVGNKNVLQLKPAHRAGFFSKDTFRVNRLVARS